MAGWIQEREKARNGSNQIKEAQELQLARSFHCYQRDSTAIRRACPTYLQHKTVPDIVCGAKNERALQKKNRDVRPLSSTRCALFPNFSSWRGKRDDTRLMRRTVHRQRAMNLPRISQAIEFKVSSLSSSANFSCLTTTFQRRHQSRQYLGA